MEEIDYSREHADYVREIIDIELERIERFASFIETCPPDSDVDIQTVAEVFGVLAEKSRKEFKEIFDFCDRKIGSLVVARANYNVPGGPEPMTLLGAELDTRKVE